MAKKIAIAIWLVTALLLGILVLNYYGNRNLIERYGSGVYQQNELGFLGFTQPYINHFNRGNVFFQLGDYQKAKQEYQSALNLKPGDPYDCKVRVNYALSYVKPIDVKKITKDNYKDTIEICETAKSILSEKDCATENNDGHYYAAQKLYNEINNFIDELKNQYENPDPSLHRHLLRTLTRTVLHLRPHRHPSRMPMQRRRPHRLRLLKADRMRRLHLRPHRAAEQLHLHPLRVADLHQRLHRVVRDLLRLHRAEKAHLRPHPHLAEKVQERLHLHRAVREQLHLHLHRAEKDREHLHLLRVTREATTLQTAAVRMILTSLPRTGSAISRTEATRSVPAVAAATKTATTNTTTATLQPGNYLYSAKKR